ncbi:MAG: aspartate carbamoyltransferase, partial [Saprospiraceae bacterium]|nr:aspartate carbamoyltransferase [Saprospiraceae bacterium]
MAEKQISTQHLLGIKDITAADINLIFDTADQFIEVI